MASEEKFARQVVPQRIASAVNNIVSKVPISINEVRATGEKFSAQTCTNEVIQSGLHIQFLKLSAERMNLTEEHLEMVRQGKPSILLDPANKEFDNKKMDSRIAKLFVALEQQYRGFYKERWEI